MTLVPLYKTCPICKKKYKWNPDAGMISCPRCAKQNLAKLKNLAKQILGK